MLAHHKELVPLAIFCTGRFGKSFPPDRAIMSARGSSAKSRPIGTSLLHSVGQNYWS